MGQAQKGDTVKVHYTGKLSDGSIFDTSRDREPLEFELGLGNIIPGFENAVIGMEPGQNKEVTVGADEAYGPHSPDLVAAIDRSDLPSGIVPKVGQQLQIGRKDGESLMVTVTDISDEKITLDGNHPLAGKELKFDIQLVEIV